MLNNNEIFKMLISPSEFLDMGQLQDGELSLLCNEILTAMERYAKIELADGLLKEENVLAGALYSILNEKFNWLNDFYASASTFVVCSGVRVVNQDTKLYLRLVKPLPFPRDFSAVDLSDQELNDIKFKVEDLKNRHASLAHSILNPKLIDEIKGLSETCNSESEFLDKISLLDDSASLVVKRILLNTYQVDRLISNNEAVL